MKIALTCSTEENKYFIRPRYCEYIINSAHKMGYDIIPVILPITDDEKTIKAYAREFDGYVFTGGDDIDPSLYGEEKLSCCGEIEAERDLFELAMLKELVKLDRPVFGICRGIQIMNVSLDGSLWQDIGVQLPNIKNHALKDASGIPRHTVITSGFIKTLCGRGSISINSYHHQSVKKLGKGLISAAISDDGIIEAVEHTSLSYFKAVQWHPEVAADSLSTALMKDFYSRMIR